MNSSQTSGWQVLATSRKLLIFCVLGLFLLAIGMDLRGEPGSRYNQKMSKRDTTSPDNTDIWQPEAGVKWQIQLVDPVEDTTVDADIWDIDLFENTGETITALKSKGHKVICYFSAGTYEDWRPDISKFDPKDFGSNLDEWPGERWLDLKSDKIRAIMISRLDIAKDKGCDGVDPDNIDAYGNENGLGLTEADSIDFLTFLAKESHSRGMAIGLKNGGDIIGSVIDMMQWSVNEQCAEYNECETYAAFTEVNKPVFHIEYSGESLEARDFDDTSATPSALTGSGATAAGSIGLTSVASDDTGNLAGPLEVADPKEGATSTTTQAPNGGGDTATDSVSNSLAGLLGYIDSKEGTSGPTTEAPTGSGATVADSITPQGSGDISGSLSGPLEYIDPKESATSTTSEAPIGNSDNTLDSVAAPVDYLDLKPEAGGDVNADVTKEENLRGHGLYKVRSRSVLSKLKISACNAANADKFSTVIKNMDLDAWVEYC
ncbi:uncharacterized protein N7500_006277 [Penicillium coprophilum]|uniref:uncharacterized protein n=1 Tax=Penicillium coprophilum TaxID=36646 RepID=UPI0023A030A1|nr:uncharacterized protein N7500_006277 [Penicillium coprophilum]KAJ5164447.1 hypothetical protein N7500_006277 [Penicillium coprophilum]